MAYSDSAAGLEGLTGPIDTAHIDDELQAILADQTPLLVREERIARRQAFTRLQAQITRLAELSVSSTGKPQSYHKLYTDIGGITVERRALFRVGCFPGLGDVARLIVNDEGPSESDVDGRTLATADYLASTFERSFTWQHRILQRGYLDNSWTIGQAGGPILQQRSDYLEIVEGVEYETHLPRVGGYCERPSGLILRRVEIENSINVLRGLGVATLEPGIEIPETILP